MDWLNLKIFFHGVFKVAYFQCLNLNLSLTPDDNKVVVHLQTTIIKDHVSVVIMEEAESTPKSKHTPSEMNWEKIKKDREDYFEKLRKWLDDARLWYSLSAGFPSSLSGIPFPEGTSTNTQQQNQQNPYAAFYQAPGFGQNDRAQVGNNQQTPAANVNNGVPFYQTYPCKFEFVLS